MTPDNRRLLTFLLVSFLIIGGYSLLQVREAQRHPPAKTAAPAASAPAAATTPAAPSSPAAPAAGPLAAVPAVPAAPEELVTLESDQFQAVFSSWGGALKHAKLKGRKFEDRGPHGEPTPIDLVEPKSGKWPADLAWPGAVVVSPELGGSGALAADPGGRASMRVVARSARSVTFEGQVGAVQLRKTYTVGDKPYELRLELQATAPRAGELIVLHPGFIAPEDRTSGGFFSGGKVPELSTPLCRAGGKTERYGGKEAQQAVPGQAAWVALDRHYFLTALLPTPEGGGCTFFRGPVNGVEGVALRLPVGADGKLAVTLQGYLGPKQAEALSGFGRSLESAVDYGTVTNLFKVFIVPLTAVMRFFHGLLGNWGVAIILLTVLVKLVLYPLTAKSMASMNEMRKLQPEVEKLKAKFGDDKEKLNVAVMQLYQQHKVNPLGGCLPMLLQMPIWFALYATLQTSVELYHERFLWLSDLTQHDPWYVLPVAMGASSFLMQKLSPQPADNAQAKMMLYFIPIFFTVIMFQLPSGLTLYILVNNLLSIAQQQWLMKKQGGLQAKAA